ncbi:MAG: Hpt domain-containing protein [Rhizobiaceae bacterium]|nr:Hpt domain-containing protein [Rhizobiaceae bacterium]
MITRNAAAVAFAMPGGESSATAPMRPIDMPHLSRQTLGDREVERDVLRMFVQQSTLVRDRIGGATIPERLQLAHGLKGAARGVGAFPIASCLTEIEQEPDNRRLFAKLARLIDEVRDFVAAISR